MPNKLKNDKWAMKAIEYLVRMDFSSKDVLEAMIEVGIKNGAVKEDTTICNLMKVEPK